MAIAVRHFFPGLLEVIPESLISGISGKWLSSLLAVAACEEVWERIAGMQKGRIAEEGVGRIFLAGDPSSDAFMCRQGKTEYFMEVMKDPGSRIYRKRCP